MNIIVTFLSVGGQGIKLRLLALAINSILTQWNFLTMYKNNISNQLPTTAASNTLADKNVQGSTGL